MKQETKILLEHVDNLTYQVIKIEERLEKLEFVCPFRCVSTSSKKSNSKRVVRQDHGVFVAREI